MAADDQVFVYVGGYDSKDDAQQDYDVVEDLHSEGVIGTYDIALITKDADGKVHVTKHEKPTQHGAVAGAVLGLLIPVGAVAGGVAGGLIGHFRRGLSRGDMEELGSVLEEGQAALVVVGKSKLDQYLDRMFERAQRRVEKAIKVDRKEFEKDLNEQVMAAQQTAR